MRTLPEQQPYRYVNLKALAKLQRLNLVARAVVEGFVSGLHRSPYHGFSVEFSQHREYVPGDNPRHLDWLALARSDRLYIKQYEEETNLRAHLLLDCSASMGFSSGGLSKLEYACYLAASLAFLMVRQQDSAGLVTFDEKIRDFVPARSTTMHLNLLLRSLEKVKSAKTTDLSGTLHEMAERIRRRGLIILISDLYEEPREVMRAISHFRHKKHEVLVFHVLDTNELEFPYRRLADFVDMETNQRLEVEPAYVRDEYRRAVREFVDGYRRECAQQHVDYVLADTSVPFDQMLFAYLSKRQKLH